MTEIQRIGSQWKFQENSYYDMKSNRLRRHDVMVPIENQLPMGNRIDFVKKMAHEKNMNIDFMEDTCKYVMINHYKCNTQMRVGICLITEMICWSNKITF